MKINTHQRYTANGNTRIFNVVEQRGAELKYTETRPNGQIHTGYARLENGIVYMPHLFAGQYYPTSFTIDY